MKTYREILKEKIKEAKKDYLKEKHKPQGHGYKEVGLYGLLKGLEVALNIYDTHEKYKDLIEE